MPRIVHFEIHAGDPERAIGFYAGVFGWVIEQWGTEDSWLVRTGPADQPGIDGGLLRRRSEAPSDGQPVNAFTCTIEVPDVDLFVAKVVAAGGSLAVPRVAVPGIGWLAYALDTEGNLFGMLQGDETAR